MHGTQRPFLKLPVPERQWKMPRKTHQPSIPLGSEERMAFGVIERLVCCGSHCSPPLLHTLSGASISSPINCGHETTYCVGLHVQESLCESTWQKPGTHWVSFPRDEPSETPLWFQREACDSAFPGSREHAPGTVGWFRGYNQCQEMLSSRRHQLFPQDCYYFS